MESLFNKRFVIVSGKGGVGRSTVSAALALAAARREKRVLIVECNARDRIPRLFDAAPVGYEPRAIHPGIETINIRPEDALREYGVMKLRFKRVYRLVFENDLMRRLVRMIPGMNDLLILGKAMFLEAARDARSGAPRWDLIVVDGPPTGQGMAMFRLPRAILAAVPTGPLADDAARIQALLTDPRRTCFNVVTLPEEMAVNEALELARQVRDELAIPGGVGFCNALWPEALSEHEEAILDVLADDVRGREPEIDRLIACVRESLARHRHQTPNVERFEQRVGLPTIRVPFVFTDEFGRAAIERLAGHIQAQLDRLGASA